MPGTRQKLKLNGHAVPLYLSVHSSRLAVRSSAEAHRLSVLEFTRETRFRTSAKPRNALIHLSSTGIVVGFLERAPIV